MTPLAQLPQMARGKGNKILGIPTPKLKSGEEFAVAMTLLEVGDKLTIYSGKKSKTLTNAELEAYEGERGRRGLKLPRLYRSVDKIEVVKKKKAASEQ